MDEITPGRLAVIIPCSFQRRKETELTKLYIPRKCTWSPVRQGTPHLVKRHGNIHFVSDSALYRPSDSLTNNVTQIAVVEQKQLHHHVIMVLLLHPIQQSSISLL